MLRLGSMLLTAVLMGVPRALDGRTFGAPAARSIQLRVAPHDPELESLAVELERALLAASYRVTPHATRGTLVVDIHRSARSEGHPSPARHAILVSVGVGRSRRPVILEHAPGQGRHAARALLEALPRPPRVLH